MARKETFFERLTKKNAAHLEEQTIIKKPKRKSKTIIILSSILTTIAIVGITVPLAVTGSITKTNDPLGKSQNVYTFVSPENKTSIGFNIGEIETFNESNNTNNFQQQLSELNKQIIYYLYNQEVEASKEYEELYNSSLKQGENKKDDLRLKTIDELKEQYSNELEDTRQNLIKRYGFANWETQYNQVLINNYDNATNTEEAINNAVFKHIKNDALRRFRLSTISIKDLIERTANTDIKIGNKNIKKGEKVFNWLKQITDNNFEGNYFKINNEYVSFMTESFIPSKKDAKSFIEYYLKNDNPYLFSQFTLPGIAKVKNTDNWTVDKNSLKTLLFAWPINNNEENEFKFSYQKVQEMFKPFNQYANILTLSTNNNLPTEAKVYNDLLQKLSLDDNTIKQNFGTSGIVSLSTLFNDNDDALKAFLSIKDIILGNAEIKEIDLFALFDTIQETITKEFNILKPDFSNAKTFDQKKEQITKYNSALQNIFDKANENTKEGLYDQKYSELITPLFEKTFNIGKEKEGNKQLFTFYKLKNTNYYLLLTTKGISIIDIQNLFANQTDLNKQINLFIQMIKNDYILNNKYNNLTGVKYNTLNVINQSLTNENYINSVLLNDDEFINYLQTKINIFHPQYNSLNGEQNPKYSIDDINLLKENNLKTLNAKNYETSLTITENISKWMKTRAQNGADEYFELKNNKIYFTYNNDNYNQTAEQKLNTKFLELLKIFQNR
ncbi:HinT-interacting membrane complex protein P80 [Mycoplasma sp. 1018B]|uniref:HinT-interacting membrane complex protein P80 n=1 Tax=Mycoplasma sp. 1018B TaxID=2967302 RepID=UPI00211C6534|nr:hypothetical protein [Mycoplasma sp. 1018B]UUM19239.1 hypothetical protein NPA14_02835 [Mycoplasma sp. 1018B]